MFHAPIYSYVQLSALLLLLYAEPFKTLALLEYTTVTFSTNGCLNLDQQNICVLKPIVQLINVYD